MSANSIPAARTTKHLNARPPSCLARVPWQNILACKGCYVDRSHARSTLPSPAAASLQLSIIAWSTRRACIMQAPGLDLEYSHCQLHASRDLSDKPPSVRPASLGRPLIIAANLGCPCFFFFFFFFRSMIPPPLLRLDASAGLTVRAEGICKRTSRPCPPACCY